MAVKYVLPSPCTLSAIEEFHLQILLILKDHMENWDKFTYLKNFLNGLKMLFGVHSFEVYFSLLGSKCLFLIFIFKNLCFSGSIQG